MWFNCSVWSVLTVCRFATNAGSCPANNPSPPSVLRVLHLWHPKLHWSSPYLAEGTYSAGGLRGMCCFQGLSKKRAMKVIQWMQLVSCIAPQKTYKMTMDKQPCEDVSPIKKRWFPLSRYLVLSCIISLASTTCPGFVFCYGLVWPHNNALQ